MTEKTQEQTPVLLDDLASSLLATIGKKLAKANFFDPAVKPWPQGVKKSLWFEIYYLQTPDGTVEIEKGDCVIETTEKEFYRIQFTKN